MTDIAPIVIWLQSMFSETGAKVHKNIASNQITKQLQ